MKLPRLKIAKSTRATISGIMIGIACLYALSMAYDEARDNLMLFFVGTLLLLLAVMGIAVAAVALLHLLRLITGKLTKHEDDSEGQ